MGFDWQSPEPVFDKLVSEVDELREAMAVQSADAQLAELGDVLFSAVNMARHLGADAEQLLREATRRFEQRFSAMEAAASAEGCNLADENSDALEARWEVAKQQMGR